MDTMKNQLRKLLPLSLLKSLRPFYHGLVALLANFYYGRPSKKMIVIGVTGTNGKSTTVNLIAKILEESGKKVGYTSTVTLKIAGQEKLNKLKMTMPSGWLLHKWMKQMVLAGCQYAVLEVSSEGLAQNRHLGIDFDVAVFTNLTPEHLDSHGGFENYKLAKAKLFSSLNHESGIKNQGVERAIVFNADDEFGKYYGSFPAEKHFSFAVKNQSADLVAKEIRYSPQGSEFIIHNSKFIIHLKGQFDVYNSLAAIAVAQSLDINLDVCKKALEKVPVVPGRVEVVQAQPFTVVVDYAYEPEEMRQLYETVARWPHNRVIQVLGPTGGGRDQDRIPVLGRMAGEFADVVVITTDDPYDDNPRVLAERMAAGVGTDKKPGVSLFTIQDRRVAIIKAFSLAVENDLVLITGKGADQKMALAAGMYVDWDDREVAREELAKMVHIKLT